MTDTTSLIDEAFKQDYKKYADEWSDVDCPITPQEETAYMVGWYDCHARFVKRTEGTGNE